MSGVIVVDVEPFRSTFLGCDAYIHDHCLGYHHDYSLFYQLPNSNLFTHHMLFSWEKPLVKTMALGLFLSYYFQIYKIKNTKIPCCNLFVFTLFYVLVIFYIYLYQISPLQVTMKGLSTPLSHWVQVFDCFVQVHRLETCLYVLLDWYLGS